MRKEVKKGKVRTAGGLLIPAGLFIGMGIGWALDYIVQGMLIGLGAGFLLFTLVILLARDKALLVLVRLKRGTPATLSFRFGAVTAGEKTASDIWKFRRARLAG